MEREKILKSIDAALNRVAGVPGWDCMRRAEWRTAMIMLVCHESLFGRYERQVDGPAISPFMIEPDTHRDLMAIVIGGNRYLARHEKSFAKRTLWNLDYAAFCAVLCIGRHRRKAPLPKDTWGIAKWLKKYYNTEKGKATAQEYLDDYRRLYESRL